MNIIVCIKEVPNPALPVEFDVEKNNVKDDEWDYILNPYDEVALEQALVIREQSGGRITVICVGSVRSEEVLRKCLSMGADEAVRIDVSGGFLVDSLTTAKVLSGAITRMSYDMVLCGDRSTDRNCGETGVMLAELLGLPVITSVVGMEIDDKGNSVTVSRRLERGAREIKRCFLPALLTTDLMLNDPRYATLAGKKKAAGQEIRTVHLEEIDNFQAIADLDEQLTRVVSITRPPPRKIFIPTGSLSPADRIRMLTQGVSAKKSSGNILEGAPDEIARKVVAFLKEKRFIE